MDQHRWYYTFNAATPLTATTCIDIWTHIAQCDWGIYTPQTKIDHNEHDMRIASADELLIEQVHARLYSTNNNNSADVMLLHATVISRDRYKLPAIVIFYVL